MDTIITGVLLECWEILKDAAPYVLFGFFAAGILKALIPEQFVSKHLGHNGTGSVFKASLFGIPLPLCSCGVIPVAIGLRKQGASKGATASFLVSVPETGVDSVAITWALLDPLMTVVRPVAAFFTAMATGILINLIPEKKEAERLIEVDNCGCSDSSEHDKSSHPQSTLVQRFKEGLKYAFSDLLKDIGGWLMLGIAIAGVISYYVPDDFFAKYMGGEFSSLLIMLVVGIPLYICASASTPIAAAMILKGLSPGAALVFLLAGPATNAATMTVIAKHLGKAATVIYVAVIAVSSLVIGWIVNRLYAWLEIDITEWINLAEHSTESILYPISAIILLLLLLWNFIPRKRTDHSDHCFEKPGES
ncbi:MAG: hypothetical protein C0623_10040 [Desulfuromonas sp.]|nr:MAG: hypothetical protein C0623_10040 [Desulfuromonas sp.]